MLIIIDDINKELEIASKNLPFATRINVFKTFCREGHGLGDNIFQFDTFASTKKIVMERPVINNDEEHAPFPERHETESGARASSPSAIEWAKLIPELSGIRGLSKWSDICVHYRLNHKGNSARRVLQKWVEKNKPNWTPVPDA